MARGFRKKGRLFPYLYLAGVIYIFSSDTLSKYVNTTIQVLMVLGVLAWWTIATFTDKLIDSNPEDKADTNDNINRKFTDIM